MCGFDGRETVEGMLLMVGEQGWENIYSVLCINKTEVVFPHPRGFRGKII